MPRAALRKRKLTELGVRKLRPAAKAFLVWDSYQRGLAVRMQPTGKASWVVVYSRQGRPRWYHIGDANSIALADARKLAARVIMAVAEGKDPAAERKAERGAGTFAELATRYLEQYAKRNNKSWKQAEALVRRFALPRWGKLQAASVTRADVKAMMSAIAAPVQANQALAAVSAIYSWGIKEDIVAANPCKLVERNETRSRERVLSDSEMPRFWQAFDHAGAVVGAALKVILLSGQRPGEVSNMRHEHLVDGWWEMPGAPAPGWPGTKNGASHRVWLPQPVREIIAELAPTGEGEGEGGEGFVFAGPRGAAVDGLDLAMREVCSKLKVERAVPHDLRRTFSSKVTALGFGRPAMNRLTNHREGGIADVYDRHAYEDENRRIMETVAQRIVTLVTGSGDGKVLPFVARGDV
jgi:integrase